MADFDWVRARAECFPASVFQQLVSGAKSDVSTRQGFAPSASEGVHFEATEPGDRLLIMRTEGSKVRRVEFRQEQNVIVIDQEGVTLRATPTLNPIGHCMLMIEGTELELWQVRRRVLENLFFDATRPVAVSAQRKKQ